MLQLPNTPMNPTGVSRLITFKVRLEQGKAGPELLRTSFNAA